jgi:hypothetical protein
MRSAGNKAIAGKDQARINEKATAMKKKMLSYQAFLLINILGILLVLTILTGVMVYKF